MIRNPLRTSVRYRDGIPAMPGDFPLVGHMPTFYRDVPEALQEARNTLGPLFWVRVFGNRWWLLWTEQESLELLKNKVVSSANQKDINPALLGDSLITIDGARHHRTRSAMNGAFMPRGIEASRLGAVTADMIDARVRGWAQKREITILGETQELTLDIIFRIMGIEPGDLVWWRKQYLDVLSDPLNTAIKLPGFPAYRAEQARNNLDRRLLEIIGDVRRSAGTPGGSSGLIAAMVQGRSDDGQALSDTELLDNIRVLILAGHETTASAMAWVVIALARHPELWEELGAEARKAPSTPTVPQEVRSYQFAEGLFRETVRLYSPTQVIYRKASAGLTIRDHRIPEGTTVGACITLLLRNAATYAPDPERFNPGRWRGRPVSSLETLPFGSGPHFCIGYHFAWMEVVQLSIALAREMARAGLRPRLLGDPNPRPVYLPFTQPPRKTRIAFN